MARTVNQIYQTILTEKAKYASLNSLDSKSEVAIWRMIFYVTAIAISAQEQLQDLFQTNLLATAQSLPTGTNKWYAAKTLEYQEGYTATYNRETGVVGYSVIDENAKILKVATCENESTNIVIKTIKDDGNGGGKELSDGEYAAVNAYIQDFKFAGPVVFLVSDPGDIIRLGINVEVNASLINSSGQSISNTSVYPVEDAINSYLLSFQNDNFDASLKLMRLVDAIQSVPGVKNVVITIAQAKPYLSTTFTNILANNLNSYVSNSGWFEIDPDYILRDNINYIV